MHVVKWNRVSGAFWVGTIGEALESGLSEYHTRNLALNWPLTHENCHWVWIGIADSHSAAVKQMEAFTGSEKPLDVFVKRTEDGTVQT